MCTEKVFLSSCTMYFSPSLVRRKPFVVVLFLLSSLVFCLYRDVLILPFFPKIYIFQAK